MKPSKILLQAQNSLTPDTASQDPSTTQNPSTPSPPSQGSADGAAQVSQETKDKLRRGLEKKWDRIKKKDVIMTSAKSLHAIGEKWSGTIPQLRKIVVDFELGLAVAEAMAPPNCVHPVPRPLMWYPGTP